MELSLIQEKFEKLVAEGKIRDSMLQGVKDYGEISHQFKADGLKLEQEQVKELFRIMDLQDKIQDKAEAMNQMQLDKAGLGAGDDFGISVDAMNSMAEEMKGGFKGLFQNTEWGNMGIMDKIMGKGDKGSRSGGYMGMLFGDETTTQDESGRDVTSRSGGLFGGKEGKAQQFIASKKEKYGLGMEGGLFGDKAKAAREETRQKKMMKIQIKAQNYRVALQKKILPKAAMFLRNALIGFLYFTLFLAAAFIVFRLLKEAWKQISKQFSEGKAVFSELVGGIWTAILDVWTAATDMWEALNSGTMSEFIKSAGEFLWSLWLVAWAIIKVVLFGTWLVIKGLFLGFWEWAKTSPGKVVAGVMAGLAIWGLWMLAKWAVAELVAVTMAIIGGVPLAILIAIPIIAIAIAAAIGNALGFFASGGIVNTPLQVVGERGPELVKLPRGSRVHSNAESQKLVGSGGSTNNIHVHVNGRVGASDSEIRDIAKKIGAQLGREINRTTNSGTRM